MSNRTYRESRLGSDFVEGGLADLSSFSGLLEIVDNLAELSQVEISLLFL